MSVFKIRNILNQFCIVSVSPESKPPKSESVSKVKTVDQYIPKKNQWISLEHIKKWSEIAERFKFVKPSSSVLWCIRQSVSALKGFPQTELIFVQQI